MVDEENNVESKNEGKNFNNPLHHKTSSDEINLSKFVNAIKKNNYVLVFSILSLLVLIVSILSLAKVNLGIDVVNKLVNLFPAWIFLFLFAMLILSTVCAYFEKYAIMFLPLLVWIMFTTAYVRTSNLSQLKDVTTGSYTLGPDLDPFLYLRHAKEILGGTLQNPDLMRYVPLGSENYAFGNLMPWALVFVFKILSIFSNMSLEYASNISPVIFFLASVVGFFLFNRSIFSIKFSKNFSTSVAILASVIYAFLPQMLHRTTGGIPEIESLGMVWFWFALLFFTLAWKNKDKKNWIIYGAIAGIFTGLMSWTWGGYRYLYMAISATSFVFFLFEKNRKKNFYIFLSWIIPALILEFLKLKSLSAILIKVSDTGFALFILSIFLVDIITVKTKLKERFFKKIPLNGSLLSIALNILLIIVLLLLFNPSFLLNAASGLIQGLLYPFGRGRVGVTVAENKVPYFSEILGNFGNLFWIFLIGSLIIFWEATRGLNKRKRITLTAFFTLFLAGLSFSRISPTSPLLNGNNSFSDVFYLGGIILFIGAIVYFYYKAKRSNDEDTLDGFRNMGLDEVLVLVLAFFALVSTRGAIRLFFIIAPLITIIVAYIPIRIIKSINNNGKNEKKNNLFLWILFFISILAIVGVCINNANNTYAEARSTIPSSYEQYWQKAMSWVRENTPEGSVFVHWWDYGYWIQTIGERPTVTDGGHPISYWDHLIGRYVLTTPHPETALSFMKTHNVSYLLIDETDLGKYSAYSSIGSNKLGNDRLSWIPVMIADPRQAQETANSTITVYQGGFSLDEDIAYTNEGKEIFLPQNKAAIAGVILETTLEKNKSSVKQPIGVYMYNNQQFRIPIRYFYFENQLLDFKNGLNVTLRVIPLLTQDQNGLRIDNTGGVIYLSSKTKDGLFAKLYLMDDPLKEYPTIKIAHTQSDPIIENLKSQGANFGEFLYYQGFRGPIKIWKVDYPDNTLSREEFLRTDGEFGEFDNLDFTK
jgi:asparagine N-glycosylation enzyme membrane subunit Stt3